MPDTTPPPDDAPIGQRQNDDRLLDLLRAMMVSHATARRLASLRMAVSVLIAASALVAAFIPAAGPPVAIVGALWAIMHSVGFAGWARHHTARGAVFQEMFDVQLYRLPWNAVLCGEPYDIDEVRQIAGRYSGDESEVRDYYEIAELPRPYDIVACQIHNLAWGRRVRRRYGQTIIAAVAGWSIVGIAIGLLLNLTVTQLALWWFVPSLGALLLGVDTYRAQQEVVRERWRALTALRQRLRQPSGAVDAVDLEVLCRQVQDLLFTTRRQHTRVPEWFFTRFRESDRADFRATIEDLSASLGVR